MGVIRTVKDLQEAIKDLPPDMVVEGYDGGDKPRLVSFWTRTAETLSKEEIEEGYPEGVVPTLILSTD